MSKEEGDQETGHRTLDCMAWEEEASSTSYLVLEVISGLDAVVQQLQLDGKSFGFEVDSGVKRNLSTTKVWTRPA